MSRAEEIERGEESADVLGVSVVAHFEMLEREGLDPLGNVLGLEDADFVDEPAANDGLFGDGPSELAAGATTQLNHYASQLGEERVAAFLRSWLSGRNQEAPVEITEALGRIEKLEEQLAARDARVAALEAADAARVAADLAARKTRNEAFVRGVQDRSAKLQAPIGADKLALRDAQGHGLLDVTVAGVAQVADPVVVGVGLCGIRADDALSAHERHLIRKVAALLHVPDADYVAAQARARDGRGEAG
jgi:hypothetical protein